MELVNNIMGDLIIDMKIKIYFDFAHLTNISIYNGNRENRN